MEDQFFLNATTPPPSPALHFEPMSAWYSLSSAMEIHGTELNYSPDHSQDCFLTPYWEISTDYGLQFDSALSSIASSPATSISPFQDLPELSSFHEESAVSVLNPNADTGSKASNSRKRKAIPEVKTEETSSAPSRFVTKVSGKTEEPNEKRCSSKENNTVTNPQESPKDYIHVRARRGEATDRHSLAERVRREKISEKMKILQDLVPGCSKIIGKALVLDQIINYVQSLQSQVEFLSMQLASVSSAMDFNVDPVMSEDIFRQALTQPIDSSASAFFGQQNPEPYSSVSNGTMVLV
ncbi:hypothetical protein V6N13_045119 [Hibiscus sabdariffa]|uniref:BHLH domain-containing protein n=1 Tax=Hibiscus sabdariffa TaxID=183260 RepID=A0ABR2RKK4_9ROSI